MNVQITDIILYKVPVFFQFFNSPVVLKNKKINLVPKKKLK